MKTDIQRFEERFTPEPNTGCWLWTESGHKFGYGKFKMAGRRSGYNAHRAGYLLYKGAIPNGMQVCHKCDVPACVNPDHMFLGTCRDNMRDMVSKGRGRNYVNPGIAVVRKLTKEQREEVLTSPLSHAEMGRRLGVTTTAIWYIRKRAHRCA